MSYAILRTKKITTPGQMAGMNNHNQRKNNVLNRDEDLTYLNHHYSAYAAEGMKPDLRTDIEGHISSNDVQTKKNSVLAIEHLMTFSPDFLKFEKKKLENGKFTLSGDVKKWNAFKESAINWIKDRYGKDNLVNLSIHYDEKTPHIHCYVVPMKEKTVKWRNANSQGEKVVKTLCARDYLGGKKKMQEMQDSFHQAVGHLGLQRGKRGSLAKHEHVQKYYERVNEAQKIERDMKSFSLSTTSIQLGEPPLMGRNDWKKREEERLQQLVMQRQKEAIENFVQDFHGKIELALESERLTRDLRRKISSLSNDLLKERDNLIKTDLKAEKALKTLEEIKDRSYKIQRAAIAAVRDQNPKAIQAIMNLSDSLHNQQRRDKDQGMGM